MESKRRGGGDNMRKMKRRSGGKSEMGFEKIEDIKRKTEIIEVLKI